MIVRTASDIEPGQVLRTKVLVVGSGAGGAVAAARLAQAGLDVLVVEAGEHRTKTTFSQHEAQAYPMLYQERMARATADQAISILQGFSVGGSTTVNWTTCYRTPEWTLANWRERFGLALDYSSSYAAVEERLNIHAWDEQLANPNNRALLDGVRAMGHEAHGMRRNVKACRNSGFCGLGCPFDAKQAMGITFLPDALAAGARVQSNLWVETVKRDGDWVATARIWPAGARAPSEDRLTIRADVVVLAGGALNTPALLLRSGLGGPMVGRYTWLHPVIASMARMPEKIHPYYGAPQSAASHDWIHREGMGFFLESAPLHPVLAASSCKATGAELMAGMATLDRTQVILALMQDGLTDDQQGGTVTLRADGRPNIHYDFTPAFQSAFFDAQKLMARIQFAAGAERVSTLHPKPVNMDRAEDVSMLEAGMFGPLRHAIFSAHQMGGSRMGVRADASVVDPEHRVWGEKDLYVMDGSVLPTSLGVNPSQTVYSITHFGAGRLAEQLRGA